MFSKVTGTDGDRQFLRMYLLLCQAIQQTECREVSVFCSWGDSSAEACLFPVPGLLIQLRAHRGSSLEFLRNHEGVRQENYISSPKWYSSSSLGHQILFQTVFSEIKQKNEDLPPPRRLQERDSPPCFEHHYHMPPRPAAIQKCGFRKHLICRERKHGSSVLLNRPRSLQKPSHFPASSEAVGRVLRLLIYYRPTHSSQLPSTQGMEQL